MLCHPHHTLGRHVEGICVLRSNNRQVTRQPQGVKFTQTLSSNDAWGCFSASNIIANNSYLFLGPLRCDDHKFAATSVRTLVPVDVPGGNNGELERDGNSTWGGWLGAHGKTEERGQHLSSASTGKQ